MCDTEQPCHISHLLAEQLPITIVMYENMWLSGVSPRQCRDVPSRSDWLCAL